MTVKEDYITTKNYCRCRKCQEFFSFKSDEARWIERSMYSEKIATCSHCGCVNVVKYQDGFNQNPNWDKRYYE